MARPLRLLVKEGSYHVTARGNRRQTVFCDDTDRRPAECTWSMAAKMPAAGA